MRRALVLVAAVLAPIAAGCGASEAPRPAAPVAATPVATVDSCARVRPAATIGRVPGLIPPRGALATKTTKRPDGSVRVDGFVPLTPTAFLRAMERRRGVKVFFRETEGHESELLLGDGRHRNFWKVIAVCPRGSKFLAIVLADPDA